MKSKESLTKFATNGQRNRGFVVLFLSTIRVTSSYGGTRISSS